MCLGKSVLIYTNSNCVEFEENRNMPCLELVVYGKAPNYYSNLIAAIATQVKTIHYKIEYLQLFSDAQVS